MAAVYKLQDLIAASLYAWETNGRTVAKHTVIDKDKTTESNCTIMKSRLKEANEDDQVWLDRAAAVIEDLLKHEMARMLSNATVSSFHFKAMQLLKNDTDTVSIMHAYIPIVWQSLCEKNTTQDYIDQHCANSDYFCKDNRTFSSKITIISSRFIASIGRSVVIGHTPEGNVVEFWTENHNLRFKDVVNISARKKEEGNAYGYEHLKCTKITYIKYLDDQKSD